MDEVAPVSAGSATLLCPEDVREKNKAGNNKKKKTAAEKTATDRKQERRKKKYGKHMKLRKKKWRKQLE